MKKIGFIVLLLFTANVVCFAFSDSTYLAQLIIPIQTAEDDTEQRGDGTIYFGSTDIELTFDPDNGNQTVGLRFQDIPVPKNTFIESAYLQFTVDEYSTGASNLTISGEAAVDSAPFSSNFQNISNRPLLNTNINWQPDNWTTIDESSLQQRSPDISDILQEIVDQNDWESGNALTLIIQGSGTRNARSFESSPQKAAKLILNLELPLSQDPISGLQINELMPDNGIITDEYYETEDWIELYNNSAEVINIGGLFLSDDADDLQKWQVQSAIEIAAGGFQLIWADDDPEQGGLHTNFKLKSEGETVYLSQLVNGNLLLLDEIQYPEIPLNLSYGRKTDENIEWITFGESTPGVSNNTSGYFMDRVQFSLASGSYESSQTLEMSAPLPDAVIRYTTDGSSPDQNSQLYTSPITIGNTTTIRARAFKATYAPGRLSTASYLINSDHEMPVVHITSEPDNLWSDQAGIYVVGTNGIPGWCRDEPANWNQDWERPATISFIETDGSLAFQKEVGIKIGGGCSRTQSQKSFNVYLRPNTYGDEPVEHELFPGLGIDEFRRFKLRDGGQDFGSMMIRDGLNQSLLYNQVDIDLMAYRPVAVYLNGGYWGMYGLREFYTKHYIESHFGIEEDNLDMIVNPFMTWGEPKEGDKIAFNALYDFILNHDLSNVDDYAYASSQIDIDEYINYNIAEIYIANYDWPSNNSIAWKPRDGGKWRWMYFDTDASANFPFWGQAYPSFNSLEFVTSSNSTNWPNHYRSTLFLRKLFQNEVFKNEFIQRTCTFIETIYEADRVAHFADSIALMVESEMPRQIDQWGSPSNLGWGTTAHGSMNGWRNAIDNYKAFFVQRPTYMRNHIRNYFSLSSTSQLHINYDAETPGSVYFHSNEMKIPFQYSGIYFKNVPIKIKAVADPGYTFIEWKETGVTDPDIDFILTEDFNLTPVFIRDEILLTEVHFDPPEGEAYEFIELHNATTEQIHLGEYTISGDIDFTFPEGTYLESNSYLILAKDPANYSSSGCNVLQWNEGSLDNSVCEIAIKNPSGESLLSLEFDESFSYFNEAKFSGKSLQLLDDALDPNAKEHWFAEKASACLNGVDYMPHQGENLLYSFYPNPASGQINITYAQASQGFIIFKVYNALGQLVFQQQLLGESFEKTDEIPLESFLPGMYFFELENQFEKVAEKVIIH